MWLLISAEFLLLGSLKQAVAQPLPLLWNALGALAALCPFLLLFFVTAKDEEVKPGLRKFCKSLFCLCLFSYGAGALAAVFGLF